MTATESRLLSPPDPQRFNSLRRNPITELYPPALGPLAAATIQHLQARFAAHDHRPSPEMWEALKDVARTLEAMADGTAEPLIHLTSLPCGVGKTQTIVHFLPAMLASVRHADKAVIVCANRLKQIEEMVGEARRAGLQDHEFACFTSDKDKLNKLGRGIGERHRARVLFTTHAAVLKRCGGQTFAQASDFHYASRPREVRVWDENVTAGLAVTVNRRELSALIIPLFTISPKLSDRVDAIYSSLRDQADGSQFTLPDLEAEYGVDLNDIEKAIRADTDYDDATTSSIKKTANALWLLSGKTVTVRNDGVPGKSMLDYEEILPPDLAPLLVLDASSREDVRETYNLWSTGRGNIKRLRCAEKDYSPATLHHWVAAGGKTAFADPQKRARLIRGIANTINLRPAERWLIVHHKNKKGEDFEGEVRALLSEAFEGDALAIERDRRVTFIHWGEHEGSNHYGDIPNVVLAGTLFLRPSQYEAIGRAAAGLPSAAGPFPKASFDAVCRGEHRHLVLQAVCRGAIRKCDGTKCPPANVYVIASRGSRIADDLPSLFPGAKVVKWCPVEKRLTGKVGAAVAFLTERTGNGAFVSNTEIMEHLKIRDTSNYRRMIKTHDDFKSALEDGDIVPWPPKRPTGYMRRAASFFGNVQEPEPITNERYNDDHPHIHAT